MTASWRLAAVVDSIPLPGDTLGGVAVGMLAQRVRPLRLPAPARLVGRACVAGGLLLVAAAWRERGPGSLEDPSSLVSTGVHGLSRNPLYVGFTTFHLGLAGATRNGWMLATVPISAALVHRWVLREERWLADRFGAEYADYLDRVPRYL
ncbi:isoprenylcysteine carboxylmethyltransferase family protein [Nocardioides cavernae]|uniref:Isoprenylcysteine carboxylmethyltransferase family protein n=1 Tax=Nocardioides cavernae TaxID=1921566 RepID=A0ABR8N514_9ACTN|nr:isoprenylcysteine carboxylmethyltransferase family protein [Nocardioides cavernae]MBD3923252.1 isoprenylcysteine carboxylmethyltransferase family protein [Nocardioides cavernae]MBM7511827.1 protein-S-isoprenylcysteine O-methyltransferase Ste14 [Nocardioides cavernae]